MIDWILALLTLLNLIGLSICTLWFWIGSKRYALFKRFFVFFALLTIGLLWLTAGHIVPEHLRFITKAPLRPLVFRSLVFIGLCFLIPALWRNSGEVK